MAEQDQAGIEEGTYEMLWACEHCDTKGLLAKSQRHCPECGAQQNPDKRYFPKEGDREVRVEGHKYEGSDQVCPACSTPMSAAVKNCTNCGSPMDGKQVKAVVEPEKPKKKFPWLKVLIIVGVIIAIIVLIVVLTRRSTKVGEITVASHKWKVSVAVEKFDEFSGDCWGNNCTPSNAEGERCAVEDHGSKQVEDGVDPNNCKKVDNKDGTFKKVCQPKYRTEKVQEKHCTFRVREWRSVGEETSSGTGTKIEDPKGLAPANAQAQLGAKRSGKRNVTYQLVFANDTCDVSEAVFNKYKDNDKIKAKVYEDNGKVVCDSIP